MAHGLRPFLTFQGGVGADALALYARVFADYEVVFDQRYGPEGPGPEGTIMAATFRVAGNEVSCADSPVDHDWGFTPAVSLWVEAGDDAELEALFTGLSEGGTVFMPLDGYGFSTRFGWVGDPFGVTWQLNLA